jgi:hypothetical protein
LAALGNVPLTIQSFSSRSFPAALRK